MSTTTLERDPTVRSTVTSPVAPSPAVAAAARTPLVPIRETAPDLVDVWGLHSFPASDPPANW